MPDLNTLIGTAIETVKKLRALSQKIKDADAKNAIADLSIALADIKMEVATLKDENLQLREQLASNQRLPVIRSKLEFRDSVYFLKDADRPEGPYCPRCLDADERLILLAELTGAFRHFGKWDCPQCRSNYG